MLNQEVLKGIANNPDLLEAVKQTVLNQFKEVPTLYTESATDEQLGQITRARLVGIQKVEAAFHAIASLKTLPQTMDSENPAY